MYIDSHAHMHFDSYDDDRSEVIERSLSEVGYLINIGTDILTSEQSIALAEKYEKVYAAVGLHPNDSDGLDEAALKTVKKLSKHEKVIAIGEIGLDYYRDRTSKESQIKAFTAQLKLAEELNLPVIVHCREAWDDVERVIEEAVDWKVKGVMHCYSGDQETAERFIKKGWYISFAGNITFKNFKDTQMVKELPIEHLLIETDSPFLAPDPFRGKRNEPKNVKLTAQRIADLKPISVEDVARITAHNVFRLFGIAEETNEPRIAYTIRDSLYLNPTIRCTADCVFCARLTNPVVKGYNLNIKHEPTSEEMIAVIGDPKKYKELVFCGYGEPLLRLEVIKEVAVWAKEKGVRVRINTNGHGNLIYERNVAAELAGLIDEISISLNTFNPERYQKIMRTDFGAEEAYYGMLDFAQKSIEAGIKTVFSVVGIPGLNIAECKLVAESTGAEFRIRKYNEVG